MEDTLTQGNKPVKGLPGGMYIDTTLP